MNKIYKSASYKRHRSVIREYYTEVGLKPKSHVIAPLQTHGRWETNLSLSTKAQRHSLECDFVKISAS